MGSKKTEEVQSPRKSKKVDSSSKLRSQISKRNIKPGQRQLHRKLTLPQELESGRGKIKRISKQELMKRVITQAKEREIEEEEEELSLNENLDSIEEDIEAFPSKKEHKPLNPERKEKEEEDSKKTSSIPEKQQNDKDKEKEIILTLSSIIESLNMHDIYIPKFKHKSTENNDDITNTLHETINQSVLAKQINSLNQFFIKCNL